MAGVMPSAERDHPSAGAQIVKQLLNCLYSVLSQQPDDLTLEFLRGFNIHVHPSADTPSWLPRPHVHPDCDNLQPPTKTRPWPGHAPYTGLEWAGQYERTAGLLTKSEMPNMAQVRPIQPANLWEHLIARGEYSTMGWHMLSILESPSFIGCMVADDSRPTTPTENKSQPFGQGELACLLSLICRQISQNPNELKHAATIISFSTETARVLQVSVDLSGYPFKSPTVRIIEQLTMPLAKATTEVSDHDTARELWLRLVSWLCFDPCGSPDETYQPLPKHRRNKSQSHCSAVSGSDTERVFSSGSDQSVSSSSSAGH